MVFGVGLIGKGVGESLTEGLTCPHNVHILYLRTVLGVSSSLILAAERLRGVVTASVSNLGERAVEVIRLNFLHQPLTGPTSASLCEPHPPPDLPMIGCF